MPHKLQVGDCIHMPYPDNPSLWWHGTVLDIQGGNAHIRGEADSTPPDQHMVVYRCPTSVVTREMPDAASTVPLPSIFPPSVPHLPTRQSRRARRRNRKRNG